MAIRGWSVSCALLVVLLGCSHDKSTDAKPDYGDFLTAAVMAAHYEQVSADTLLLVVPETNACDSLGLPVVVPGDTCRAWYSLSSGTFRIAIKDASSVVRIMTSGPSFSPAIGEFLTMLDTMTALQQMGINILGVFARMEGSSGMVGQWRFTGMEPVILYAFLDSAQKVAIQGMVADQNGDPALMFRFDAAGVMTGLLSRYSYGKAAVEQVLDTVSSNLSITACDSIWTIAGNTSGDTTWIAVDSLGNEDYTTTMAAGSGAPYRYWLHPTACPNALAPAWLGAFLVANARL